MFFFTLFRSWREDAFKTFQLNLMEFLQDETRDLPASAEVEMFYEKISKLELDTKRLEEKLNQLHGHS